MISRAVAPARKYFVSHLPAASLILRTACRIAGSILSCLISKGGTNVLVINHPSGFNVSSFCGSEQIGVGQYRRNNIINPMNFLGVPKDIKNLDVSLNVSSKPVIND